MSAATESDEADERRLCVCVCMCVRVFERLDYHIICLLFSYEALLREGVLGLSLPLLLNVSVSVVVCVCMCGLNVSFEQLLCCNKLPEGRKHSITTPQHLKVSS